ncbi:MAG: hypothetical protein E7660_06520 [Ruminococcaceae bacterium]|nr:hypothetical protein [Oscillospiraceae bacterium]
MKNTSIKRILSLALALITVITGMCFASPEKSLAADGSVELVFDSADAVQYWAHPNNLNVSYDQYEEAMEFYVTTAVDPYVLLNVEGAASVSADTHKYVVITYKVPVTNADTANKTELFMSAGSIAGPTAGCSVIWQHSKSFKYQTQIIDMSGVSFWTGAVHSIRFDVFQAGKVLDYFYVSSVVFCNSAAAAEAASEKHTARANGYVSDIPEGIFASTGYIQDTYLTEYWKDNVVYNESVFPLCDPDGSIPPMTLMYDVKRIISVRDGTLGKVYKYGVDYTISDGKLIILPTGSIPRYAYSNYKTYTDPKNTTYWIATNDGGWTNVNRMADFHKLQLNVTYTHEDTWEGPVIGSKLHLLPNTYAKLQSGERLVVVFNGDSVTYGCDASSYVKVNPNMPIWADMTIAALKKEYNHNVIDYANTAVGGTVSAWGAENVYENISKYVPDLVFLGFGTNDGSLGVDVATYEANMRSIIASVRTMNPNCEFILMAPCVPNRETPMSSSLHEQYISVLERLEGEGVALVNMQEIHDYMVSAKKYVDMTSNNVNHPNDFFIRFYTQAIMATMTLSDIEETRSVCLSSLERYADLADYRAEEQAEIKAIKEAAVMLITSAETEEEMRAALADAKAAIDKLKTALEYDREDIDFTKLVFNNQAIVSLIEGKNSVSVALDTADRCTDIVSLGGDPWARISYAGSGLSANQYKYVTIVYKVPETVSNTSETQVFFTTSAQTGESEDFSIKFTAVKGEWACQTIYVGGMAKWSGDVNSIRIDPFGNYKAGDSFSLHAVALFETQSEANEYGAKVVGNLSNTYAGINSFIVFDSEDDTARLTSSGEEYLLGDVTGDGDVTAKDVLKIKRYISGILDTISNAADVNGDGEITSKDTLIIKKIVANVREMETVSTKTADISFDSTKTAAAVTSTTDGEVTVTLDLSDKALSADIYKHAGFVYMTDKAAQVEVTLLSDGKEIESAKRTFSASAGASAGYADLDFEEDPDWTGSIGGLVIRISGLANGESFCLSSVTFSENANAAARAATYKVNTANRLMNGVSLVTGQQIIPMSGTTTVVSYGYYNGTSGDSFTYPNNLSVLPDNQPEEPFDRFTLTYTASTLTRGVINYYVNGTVVSDEFFLEATTAPKTFTSLILGYFDGKMATEIESIVLYPISASSSTFSLKAINTEDYDNYSETIFLENENVKVGVLLSMGGGISHYEQLNDGIEKYGNLLNRYDEGRLIQQSYYGIDRDPYEMGLMNGQAWRYNPVQGGDVSRNPSRLVDFTISDDVIYVKTRPMDWGHNGHLTPSYMENNYVLHEDFLEVYNRFVDFSTYTHTKAAQELPAFYTVSALDTFSMYTGNSPWTGGAYTDYENLEFWAGNKSQYYDITSGNENWFAFHDSTGFGVGLYVPGAEEIVAGRFMFDGSASENAASTNYFAPLRTMTLKAGKPIEYSYLVCAGNMNDMRQIFNENKGLVNNTSLIQY